LLSKLWLPAVVLVVIGIVSYGVTTVRGLNAAITNPPSANAIPATVVQINPKNVTYEVFGTPRRQWQSHLRRSQQPARRK